jgi:uncharacterized pyridoxamine 5'-phosphate oxidase family protein
MNFQDCIDFIVKYPDGFVATVENDQPRVRPLTVWRADATGFYFYLPKFKRVYSQLRAHPKVEIAFFRPPGPGDVATLPGLGTVPGTGTLLRITGQCEFLEDGEIRRRLFAVHPWLLRLGDGADTPMIAVFRIASGTFSFWTLENNSQSHPAPQGFFGGRK